MIAEERQVCLLAIHPTLNVVSKLYGMNCSAVVLSIGNGFVSFKPVAVLWGFPDLYWFIAVLKSPLPYPNFLSEVPSLAPSNVYLGLRKEKEKKMIGIGALFVCLFFIVWLFLIKNELSK